MDDQVLLTFGTTTLLHALFQSGASHSDVLPIGFLPKN